MRNIWIVFRRELLSYFVSPVAYALFVVFLALTGWYFYNLLTAFVLLMSRATDQAMMTQQMPPVVNVNMAVMRTWFNVTSQLMLFIIPIVTMRLLSEERGTGRLDMLLSAPITDAQLVLGKYLAAAALCALLLAPTLAYPAILFRYGNPEFWQIVSGYVGLLLLSWALIGLGLAISSATGNQVVAAACTFGLVVLLWVLGIVSGGEGTKWGAVLSYVAIVEHYGDFANGVIETRHVVYFFSFALFMLFLTLRSVESQRWRG
jgi:ABC-2 type transport system permease protein